MGPNVLVFLMIAGATAALLFGLSGSFEGRSGFAARIKRRLEALSIDDPREFLRRRSLGEGMAPWLAAIVAAAPFQRLNDLIHESGVRLSTEQMLGFVAAAVGAVAAALNFVAGFAPVTSIAESVVLSIALPLLTLFWMRDRRRRRIVEQLPEALDMFVRSLRAGHPLPTAIRMVADEMPAPIAIEFGAVFDGITYGLDLRDALQRMTRRVPVPELQYMVSAIRIQHATGGSLAEILSSLSRIMRERAKLLMKVKALSGEARLSGKILAAMPIVVVALIYTANPHFYDGAHTDTALALVLYFAAFLVALGIFLLQRIVSIRV